MTIHSIATGDGPDDALSLLTAELSEGRVGVIFLTVEDGGKQWLTICGKVTAGDLALAGAHLTAKALAEGSS